MKKLFFLPIVLAIILGFSTYGYFVVSGSSMENSFFDNEKIIVNRYAYLLGGPKRGDIVLLEAENKTFIKRIVALPEETIEITNGEVKINDEVLREDYVKTDYTYGDKRVFLDKGQFFFLGDNREPNQSIDSRILGPVLLKDIKGKVILRVSPDFTLIGEQEYK